MSSIYIKLFIFLFPSKSSLINPQSPSPNQIHKWIRNQLKLNLFFPQIQLKPNLIFEKKILKIMKKEQINSNSWDFKIVWFINSR